MKRSEEIREMKTIPFARAEGIVERTLNVLQGRLRVDGKFFARGKQRLRLQGVTYGPFAANADGDPFPAPWRVEEDFQRMQEAGINAIRTYHLPPTGLLEAADVRGIGVFVDVPWRKHLCFLDCREAREEARQAVRRAAQHGRDHPSVLAYSIGNEIPPAIVRWHGARRIERFLAELADEVRHVDPQGLVTYTSFPPTEYLELPFLDFLTFNVYLHDRPTFRRYLSRLQNLAGDKPLLLGELGMDTLRHGQSHQAAFLAGHVREALLMGLAGAFVFSWTDDWFTGGHPIEDWAFGITDAQRRPKQSYRALAEVFASSPAELLPATPRVSVIVCSYNGGATLEQCLRALLALAYPNYEIVLVDDGSTDDTRAIVARYPSVRAIHQANHGLSVARNVGLWAATGTIIAYTDSDCFADPDWLTHLVYQLQHSGAAAVGGPNLTPEDGWLAACVAASPGQPTHVLESEQVAEHIPGCNMAFRREALQALNGFDYQYKKAGDDVDVCWRLQQAGFWITFAPGAFVWHHRRQTVRAYLRQQAGYGEAEALLQFKHPERFNGRGDGKWRGVLYGASLQGLRLGRPIVYRGTFGTGLFQCLYQPGPAHWAMLPATLEWHLAAALAALGGVFWSTSLLAAATMLVLSLGVAALQAGQAILASRHEGWRSRLLIMVLCYVQPLVRSWRRYRTRLFGPCLPAQMPVTGNGHVPRMPLSGRDERAYWSEQGHERAELLGLFIAYLLEHRWGTAIDAGWSDWDIEAHAHPWTLLQIRTVQEEHGSHKNLIRVGYRLRRTAFARAAGLLGLMACGLLAVLHVLTAGVALGLLLALMWATWRRGLGLAARAIEGLEGLIRELELVRCGTAQKEEG
jgi:O-antigen biosynthesis protein